MPTFDFTSPEGKVYTVEGPEGATQAQAFEILQSRIGGALPKQDAAPSIGIGEDLLNVAKSAPGRLVAGVAGLPGDLYHLGLRALGDKLTPESAYGSHAIRQGLGSDYEAQRAPGKIAQNAVDFAPAVIGGPETMALKLATRVAAPAVASEIGNEVAGPIGGLAGALGGAAGATAAARKFQTMAAARNAAPELTALETKAAARAGYQSQDVKDVKFAAAPTNDLADKVTLDLRANGFRPNIDQSGKPVFQLVDELRGASNVADIDGVRRALSNIAKERDQIGQLTPNAAAAVKAIDHVTDFLPNLKQADLIAGDAGKAASILEKARGDWAAYKKASLVQNTLGNAELNAAAAHSGGNLQNSIKQAFKPLLKNDGAKVASWSDAEKAQLEKIVKGTFASNTARVAGNILGGGGGLGMLASGAAGYQAGGAPGAIAAGLAGRGLKMAGARSTFNAVKKLDQMIRAGSPEALRLAAQAPPQVIQQLPTKTQQLLQSLILADPVLSQPRQAVGQPSAQ